MQHVLFTIVNNLSVVGPWYHLVHLHIIPLDASTNRAQFIWHTLSISQSRCCQLSKCFLKFGYCWNIKILVMQLPWLLTSVYRAANQCPVVIDQHDRRSCTFQCWMNMPRLLKAVSKLSNNLLGLMQKCKSWNSKGEVWLLHQVTWTSDTKSRCDMESHKIFNGYDEHGSTETN